MLPLNEEKVDFVWVKIFLIIGIKLTKIVKVAFHLFFSPGLASNFAVLRSDSFTKSPLQSQVTLGFGLACT